MTVKPLPKSLHTVSVIVNVALHLKPSQFPPLPNENLIARALQILGYDLALDPYNLAAVALKQLNALPK